MRFFSSHLLGGLLGVSVIAASFAACGGEVDTHYGPPSGLTGKSPPLPSGVDASSPPPVTGGDGGTPSALCGGKGPIDGGACAVSWKTAIHAKFGAGAAWKCADANCHGTSAANPPLLKGTDADSHADYLALAAWTKIKATPYINPCSTDPAKSTFACNVSAATCGGGDLRMPVGTPLTAADEADLKTWVACGSPEN